jgi:hypothetical protein
VRNRLVGKFSNVTIALVLVLSLAVLVFTQAAPASQGGAEGQRGGQRGGRGGQNAGPSEPTPRLPDGTVNLGRVPGEKGIWNVPYIQNMANYALNRPHTADDGGRGAGGGGGSRGQRGGAPSEPWIPFQPWAAAVYNYNSLNESKYDPEGYCLPPGGPRLFATPYPAEIIQLPEQKRIIMIFEGGTHVWREIYMDGRPHPPVESIKGQTWLGHSVGHWEGDTLVVDLAGLNEGTWLDYYGHPHTDQIHVTEKYTRPNKNTLHYEATINDPGAYMKPWTVAWDINWNANGELQEYICQENNKYLIDLKDDFGNPVLAQTKE